MRTEPATYEPGTVLYDTAAAKVGEYRGRSGARVLLRPLGGGREWEAEPPVLRPATDRERLGASLRAANDRTLATPPAPAELERPPLPVPDCEACAWLAERRETARAAFDHSAVTDANVLLRQHQRKEHEG
ncbi:MULTISPECIES: hypothetical protein [Streptomyces violaceoruber group]|uniref:Uncharacterized protein n=1 Tax=Streptomyces violaceoruber TaxID=1935 RepID=A0ACD4WNS4_STRVN|nr:hypothetical protein [Streptomyces anthocyanicus]WOY99169.1 hypothetical protein R2E43_17520 [Streptomyces violaceoruber]WTE19588.1 hypothetical protein OH747_18885 [Streptomyces anthocyanicus]BDD73685.1 hypothetical protein JCM4020_43050 [Streptomyces coelicolor]GHC36052.1 hypothetical protein GCM10010348_74150 [Streptomyces anthocyanicus]